MPDNVIVSYTLHRGRPPSGSDYEAVAQAIRSIDPSATKVLDTVWHLLSDWPILHMQEYLLERLEADDELLIVNTVLNTFKGRLEDDVWADLERRWRRSDPLYDPM